MSDHVFIPAHWDLSALPALPTDRQGTCALELKCRTASGRAVIVRPSGCTSMVCGWKMCKQRARFSLSCAAAASPVYACAEHRLERMEVVHGAMRSSRQASVVQPSALPPGCDSVDKLISMAAAEATAPWVAIERAGIEAHERWAYRRRIGWGKMRCGKGGAEGSREALYENQGVLTLVCAACGALVDKGCAKRAAQRAGRSSYAAGDGCASPTCAMHRIRAARFDARQSRMRAQLRVRQRLVMRWPSGVRDKRLFVLPLQNEGAASPGAV